MTRLWLLAVSLSFLSARIMTSRNEDFSEQHPQSLSMGQIPLSLISNLQFMLDD